MHNLRVATGDLEPDVAVLAFVDADARPGRDWLRAMVTRLDTPGVGAVSGYRWFVPQRASLANVLLYSVNCGLASLLGKKGYNYVWGGSWAVRRDVFQEVGLHRAWKGTLSDDLVASRVLHDAGYRVAFEPAAVVQSPLDYRFREMLGFLRRQYIIGRVYSPGLWAFGLLMTGFANLMMAGSLAAAVAGLLVERSFGPAWSMPAVVFTLLYGANVFRAVVRQDAAMVYFPQLRRRLRAAQWCDVVASPLFGLVNWLESARTRPAATSPGAASPTASTTAARSAPLGATMECIPRSFLLPPNRCLRDTTRRGSVA